MSELGARFSLNVYPTHPVPYLNVQTPFPMQGVIDFPAQPDWPTGYYTVTVKLNRQSVDFGSLRVNPPRSVQSFILPIPVAGHPGDTFKIFYVNYPKDRTIDVTLYSVDPPVVLQEYPQGLVPRMSWQVLVTNTLTVTGAPPANPAGWAIQPFTFPPEAVIDGYAVAEVSAYR